MVIRPIGIIRTCFGEKFAVPRQPGLCPSAWGVIELCEEYRSIDALRGLDGFSHVWLIFGFHETSEKGWHPTVRPPRLGGNERVGVFASRSTFRPNGLGLSLVKLDRIDTDGTDGMTPPLIHVSGVDLIDGTPIYDIKPYLPYAEALPDAQAGYAADSISRFKVEIDPQALPAFRTLDARAQEVILEVLSFDARPAASPKADDKTYGADLCGRNIRFQVVGETCRIVAIENPKS
jgi:tRNA-Thr(GGU) m(6)t(6)A37 methyltransferase TsaA